MAIKISGDGSITGVSVGGLPDGTVDTDTLAANAVTEPKLGADQASGLIKAWATVDINGTILDSFNIASCVVSGSVNETYTYTFINPMANTNYGVVATENATDTGDNTVFKVANKTTTEFATSGLASDGTFGWVAQSGAHAVMVISS